jgi:hypothetical protein
VQGEVGVDELLHEHRELVAADRATTSPGRDRARRRSATTRSTSSPAEWPTVAPVEAITCVCGRPIVRRRTVERIIDEPENGA